MSIGYACLTVGVQDTDLKSCIAKNAREDKLLDLIAHNLNSLEQIIDYNITNQIRLFRISSNLIPFGSSPVNSLLWWDIFASRFLSLGEKIQASGMRVSMHPGQYTILNSPHEDVVKRAVEDLNYHARVLDMLGVGMENKIILHIGGTYNDKKQAAKRFITNYQRLDEAVQQRLVLENDDKSYNISEVLEVGKQLDLPVVFDNLHHAVNPCDSQKSEFYWINACKKTWRGKDGCQKIHYSQQNPRKKPGAHSDSIRIKEFMEFYKNLANKDIDIMLEVKDKNLSAIKCINCTSVDGTIKVLEIEWNRYKYKILEKAPSNYFEIQKLLKNKENYPAIDFYNLIEEALEKENNIKNSINAALHIWEYFKDIASNNEKNKFFKSLEMYRQGKIAVRAVKNILWKLSIKYKQLYLLDSYYFVFP